MQDKFYRLLVDRALRENVGDSLGEIIDETRRRLDARQFGPGAYQDLSKTDELPERGDSPVGRRGPDAEPGAPTEIAPFRGGEARSDEGCECSFRFTRSPKAIPARKRDETGDDWREKRDADGATLVAFARTTAMDGFESVPSVSVSGIEIYEFTHVSNCPECVPVFHVNAEAGAYVVAEAVPMTCDDATAKATVVCFARGDLDWNVEAAAVVKEKVKADLQIDFELDIRGQKVQTKYAPKVAEKDKQTDSDVALVPKSFESPAVRFAIASRAEAVCSHDDEATSLARARCGAAVAVLAICRCPGRQPKVAQQKFGGKVDLLVDDEVPDNGDRADELEQVLVAQHLPPVPLPPVSVAGGTTTSRTRDCAVTVSFLDATSTDSTRPTPNYRFDIRVDIAGAPEQTALLDGAFDAGGRFQFQGNPILTRVGVPEKCDDRVPVSIGVAAARARSAGSPFADGDRKENLDGQMCTDAGTVEDVTLSFTRLGTARVDLMLRISRRCTRV